MSDATPPRRRVLLDEMLPRLLARDLPEHDVTTVAQQGPCGSARRFPQLLHALGAVSTGHRARTTFRE